MTGVQLLLPLRVPELGPYLGKLVSGVERGPDWIRLDSIRYKLVTRIFEAAGTARRLAAKGERAAALSAVGRANWQEAWEESVNGVAAVLLEHVSQHLDAEAIVVGMPHRLRRRLAPGAAERRSLGARLGAAGSRLINVLDQLELAAAGALDATALQRDVVEHWQEALRSAARRLEEAWLSLEQAVGRESVYWSQEADRIAQWRKPIWPVVVVSTAALGLAIWLGLIFAGYIRPPAWFSQGWAAVFGK